MADHFVAHCPSSFSHIAARMRKESTPAKRSVSIFRIFISYERICIDISTDIQMTYELMYKTGSVSFWGMGPEVVAKTIVV